MDRILGEPLQVGPDLETRDPLLLDVVLFIAEGDSEDPGIFSVEDLLQPLVARRIAGFRQQPGQNDDLRLHVKPG